jgi:hypothetical protein
MYAMLAIAREKLKNERILVGEHVMHGTCYSLASERAEELMYSLNLVGYQKP